MYLVPLYVDGREGACGAQVFAGSAADAACRVYGGHFHFYAVGGGVWYHGDGPCRTVAGAVAALHTVGQWDAVLLDPYGMAYLRGGLDLRRNGLDGPSGAHGGAAVALWPTVAALVAHGGLHESG